MDIDRTALLDRKLAERACGVAEGDGMERKPQLWLQQIEFYCEESCQCSGITKEDVPSVQKLPLEGEWTVCASSKLLTTKVELYVEDVNMNAHICHGATCWHANDVSHPGGRTDGSEGLTDVSKGLADGSQESTDLLGKLKRAEMAMLGCRDRSSKYLGPGDAKRLMNKTDGAGIHADRLTGQADAPSVEMVMDTPENEAETISKP